MRLEVGGCGWDVGCQRVEPVTLVTELLEKLGILMTLLP